MTQADPVEVTDGMTVEWDVAIEIVDIPRSCRGGADTQLRRAAERFVDDSPQRVRAGEDSVAAAATDRGVHARHDRRTKQKPGGTS
jgi:hypothetical protein